MKSRFTTIDLRAVLAELGTKLLGLRVLNIYDVNNKTYLVRLGGTDKKVVLLFESGTRIHTTSFDWPKSQMPSNFAMKLRKHLRNRRLVEIKQLGVDRVVDLQFGSEDAAYHLVIELYDRGNIALTDHEYTILTLWRTRKDSEDVRFAVREKYPVESARVPQAIPPMERIKEILSGGKPGDNIKKLLNPHFIYGPALIDHCLQTMNFPSNAKRNNGFDIEQDLPRVMEALIKGEQYVDESGSVCKGYIIQKREKKPSASPDDPDSELLTYSEFHPFLFKQHESQSYQEFDTFDQAVDEFFSQMESQKLDMKVLHQEKDALKKLDNVRKDHEKRINSLQKDQELNEKKGALIEVNLPLVEKALQVVRSAVANQIDWKEIENIIKEAQTHGDPVAMTIKTLRLDTNHFQMMLRDPFAGYDEEESDDDDEEEDGDRLKPQIVDIDLALSAYANARKYFVQKKSSQKKEQRTVESSTKAIKSAEKKTMQALKDVAMVASINKSRKTYWFEKFFWCISSENYIIIAGRDQQQNEMIVKKYLSQGDIYVHADLHGASSVIIKNPSGGPVPPKTLQEGGTMAVCYSVAWDAKVITSAWWVRHDQVSKTAPTGEYLTTGSFMIRGKKNYLPPTQLVMGFGFLLKIDDSCVWRHKEERRIRGGEEEELSSVAETMESDLVVEDIDEEDEEEEEDNADDEEQVEGTNNGNANMENVEDDNKVQEGNEEEAESKDEVKGQAIEQEVKGQAIEQEVKGQAIKQEAGEVDEKEKLTEHEDKENFYPDTTIQLHHVQGDRYETQRSRGSSMLSTGSFHSAEGDVDEEGKAVIYLGDDKPIIVGGPKAQAQQRSNPRLSAKQRRDLKKQKKTGQTQDGADTNQREQILEERRVDSGDDEDDEGEDRLLSKEEEDGDEEEEEDEAQNGERQAPTRSTSQSSTSSQAAPPKRGQKHKMKKIKQKYKDQDEDERRIRMEILASAGGTKEVKGKKGRKAKRQEEQLSRVQKQPKPKHQQQQQQQQQQQKQHQKQAPKGGGKRQTMSIHTTPSTKSHETPAPATGQEQGQGSEVKDQHTVDMRVTREDVTKEEEGLIPDDQPGGSSIKPVVKTHTQEMKKRKETTDEGEQIDEEDEEADAAEANSRLMEESVSVLDTLTGIPDPEDILLFAIPVCAPYNIMHNYKFKVKLMPGTSKKGKAAKTALNMFQHLRETTQREKDLFKGVKDVDLSRNIPGKVKVSAPNLHQNKKKK